MVCGLWLVVWWSWNGYGGRGMVMVVVVGCGGVGVGVGAAWKWEWRGRGRVHSRKVGPKVRIMTKDRADQRLVATADSAMD
jgi:hypothetical protein